MTLIFFIVAAACFLFMTVIWSKKGWANIFFKMFFTIMFVWATVLAVQALGFIIKR